MAKKNKKRPPIVVVLGHVDHGKTTLLDKIRETSVATREAGGITQSIGASQYTTKEGKEITFIDTPGHAAFSNMRSQGAAVADIAVLVIAANDGIKPQTKEALKYIKGTKTPFIVAATKIDLPAVDVGEVEKQLEKENVKLEKKGGDVPLVAVSGKTGKGVEDLLEMIILVSEVNEIAGSEKNDLEAFVIETDKDKRGPLVSMVVKDGMIKGGDKITAGGVTAKARGLFNFLGKPVEAVGPGEPVQVIGFSELPSVGSKVTLTQESIEDGDDFRKSPPPPEVEEGEIPVVIKASSAGALEAIVENVPEGIVVVYSGVGDVTGNDIFLAKSASDAVIFTLEAKAPSQMKKLAKTEGVKIREFEIIYKLFEELEEMLKKGKKKVKGKAKILASFPFNRRRVAGCKVVEGTITNDDKLTLEREGKQMGKASILSMKKEKQDITKAIAGEEFGVVLDPQLDFKVDDVLISVR
jgi:translation initiation factor IF-2